jgi:hypothetical protein
MTTGRGFHESRTASFSPGANDDFFRSPRFEPGKLCQGRWNGSPLKEVETLELIRRPYPGIIHVLAWR